MCVNSIRKKNFSGGKCDHVHSLCYSNPWDGFAIQEVPKSLGKARNKNIAGPPQLSGSQTHTKLGLQGL